jgi:hypothetical protein
MKVMPQRALHVFQTNTCPICNQVLRMNRIAGVTVYHCPEAIEYQTSKGVQSQSHYEVESDSKDTIQNVYALPFCVTNFSNQARSRVFKLDAEGQRPWKFLADVPFLNPSQMDAMINRIYSFFPNE